MTVTYTSDRPGVVTPALKTLANGVATVTANVSYKGVTKSTTFVVRVIAQLNGVPRRSSR